jgi:hypothetical protein
VCSVVVLEKQQKISSTWYHPETAGFLSAESDRLKRHGYSLKIIVDPDRSEP